MSISAQAFDAFWLRFLSVLWQHRDKLDDIVDLATRITTAVAAKDFVSAIEAVTELVKLIVAILSTPTTLAVVAFADESVACASFEAARIGDGALLRKIRDFLNSPTGQALVDLLKEWFGL